jgi:hypothetical protein
MLNAQDKDNDCPHQPSSEALRDPMDWGGDRADSRGFGKDFVVQDARIPSSGRASTTLEIALGCHEAKEGAVTLAVRITNVGNKPISSFGVAFVYTNEMPQPGQLTSGSKFRSTACSHALTKEGLFDGTLRPGASATFALECHAMETVASMTSRLVSEHYKLVATSGETEVAFVAGADLEEFLEGYGDSSDDET